MHYLVVGQFRILIKRAEGKTALLQFRFRIIPLLFENELHKSGPKTDLTEALDPGYVLIHVQSTNKS